MKGQRTLFILIITLIVFWFIKFYLGFTIIGIEVAGVILTIASILFGFLAGFFISELWSRYCEIRTIQGIRSSAGLNMIRYAEYFYKNKNFEDEFKKLVEKSSVVDEIVEWDEGHLEIPYYRNIETSFRLIKDEAVKNKKDEIYFENLLDSYDKFVESTVKLDILGKERLFPSEWSMMILLSLVVACSVLFLDISNMFFQILVLLFPAIISLALVTMFDLDTLNWSKEIISLEPNQKMFDAIGVKRFYLTKKKKYLRGKIKCYRTEKDLKGELKKAYQDIINNRKKK